MNSLYSRLGGEKAVRDLVEVFYDIIDFEPEGHALKLLHLRGHGVAHSRIEQFNLLPGFLGGPKLYAEKHGHSNVREMHQHVEINAEARGAWLKCMTIAMNRLNIEETGVTRSAHRRFKRPSSTARAHSSPCATWPGALAPGSFIQAPSGRAD